MTLSHRRSRVLIVAAVLVATIGATAIVFVTTGHTAHVSRPTGHVHPTGMPTSSTAKRPRAVPTNASPGTGLAVPTIDLSQIRWMDYDGCQLPISPTAGPRSTAGGVASGFADSPAGALLAAVNIAVRTSWEFGPQVFQTVIENQVTGQYQADLLTDALDSWDQAAQQDPDPGSCAEMDGFAWQYYSSSAAALDVAESATVKASTVTVAAQVQLQWIDGDWEVVAPDGGDWSNVSTELASLTGYTLFPGQGG